jgi:hypothetical protein
MLKVLTFDVPALVTLLRTAYFRSLGVRVITACSSDDLLERAVRLRPDLVLVVDERVPPRFARALRACVGERRAQLVLVVGDGETPDADELINYDGVVSLADPELELARLVAMHAPARVVAGRAAGCGCPSSSSSSPSRVSTASCST